MKRFFVMMIAVFMILMSTSCRATNVNNDSTAESSGESSCDFSELEPAMDIVTEVTTETTTMPMTVPAIKITISPTTTSTLEITTEPVTTSALEITTAPVSTSVLEITTEPITSSVTEITTNPEIVAATTDVSVFAEYTVQPEDTLYKISNRHGISIESIIEFNNLDNSETIYIGQILLLPGIEVPVYDSNESTNYESDYTVWNNSVTLYTTGADESSWYNIELAVSYLNGMKLSPGESFSWANYMGPNDTSQGYCEAAVYSGGQIDYAPGGGVCFVSTTLMQAARGAGCVITEKHDHSLPVSYASPGDEASVSWGSWDLSFYNPSNNSTLVFYASVDPLSRGCTISCNIE